MVTPQQLEYPLVQMIQYTGYILSQLDSLYLIQDMPMSSLGELILCWNY